VGMSSKGTLAIIFGSDPAAAGSEKLMGCHPPKNESEAQGRPYLNAHSPSERWDDGCALK
jgi:hypothetical protein